MDLKITVHCDVDGKPRAFDLEFQQDLITIGRHSQNDVQIPDMQVSAEHARVIIEDDEPYLIDLGAAIGTFLDGEKVLPNKKVPLPDGAELAIGEYLVVVARPHLKLDDTATEKTAMVAMKMVKEVLGTLTGGDDEPPYLEVMNDDDEGARLDLAEDDTEYRIGREKVCDLILSHWSISRKHAMVRRKGSDVTLMDLGSKNGVLLNDDRLEKNESRRLADGDVITVGHTEMRFRDPGASLLDSMDDSPTPLTDLKDLGLDLGEANAPPSEPSRAPEKKAPARSPVKSTPPALPSDAPPARRRRKQESSIGDYLPLILGGVLLVGALIAALFLFVLKD